MFTGQCEAQTIRDTDIIIDALGTNYGIIMFTIKTARKKKVIQDLDINTA